MSASRSRRSALLAALLVGLFTASATAQRRPPRRQAPAPAPERPKSLKAELGLDAAKVLLRSDSSSERLRGFERLSAIGSEAALELLGRSLDAGGAARDGRERVSAVRALAPHARSAVARAALVRALGASASLERADPLLALARQTAALALARSGDVQALTALAQALRQAGRGADAALAALSAYPPAELGPLLRARGAVTAALLSLFEALDDPRARGLLYDVARRSPPELRARALIALARVHAPGAAELARSVWAKERHPTLRAAAARALSLSDAADARQAVEAIANGAPGDASVLDTVIDIALESPHPDLTPLLERLLAAQKGERAERLVAALGRAGGSRAAALLERALAVPAQAPAAAYALALAPGRDALRALERALASQNAVLKRLAVRAAALRHVALRETAAGLERASRALAAGPLPVDRAAGAFALALLVPKRGAELVRSTDLVVVRAVARAALSSDFASAAADRLEGERDALTRAALAIALADDRAADRVSSATLERLLESGGAPAALAARALAARDSESLRPRLEQLLESSDRTLRAHTALGLARSHEASVVGLLAMAYRFEIEPQVRRAIVGALSQRSESGRLRTLELAAAFDPDPATRQSAKLALAAVRLSIPLTGSGTLWLEVRGTSELVAVAAPAPGVSLPAVPDPDGLVALAGLPAGALELSLAPAAIEGKESARSSP